jgi:hypothetical protein
MKEERGFLKEQYERILRRSVICYVMGRGSRKDRTVYIEAIQLAVARCVVG